MSRRLTPDALRFAAEWCEAYEAATEEEFEPLATVADFLRREAESRERRNRRALRDSASVPS